MVIAHKLKNLGGKVTPKGQKRNFDQLVRNLGGKATPKDQRKAEAQRANAAFNFASLYFAFVVWAGCFIIIVLIIVISSLKDGPSELLEQILEYALTATFTVIASVTGYVFGSKQAGNIK